MTKEQITELKKKGVGEISALIGAQRDVGSINYILENLGQLPKEFDSDFLYALLEHNHAQVRRNAVKNIAKLNGKFNVDKLSSLYKTETNTEVRREIVSAIGRQRASAYKPLLCGFWSTAGKRAEKYLMLTLCRLYQVPEENIDSRFIRNRAEDVDREVDFYLVDGEQKYRCEVKLMGKGNPENADAIIARDSKVFIGDTLSQQNKDQCDQLGVYWVALRDVDGYRRFKFVLEKLNIPHVDYNGDLNIDLPPILDEIVTSDECKGKKITWPTLFD